MSVDMDRVEEMVRQKLADFPENERWPEDIIDRVFCAIEADVIAETRYNQLVRNSKQDRDTVNQNIGKIVKRETGLQDKGKSTTPKSKLLTSFTLLH